MTKTVKHWTAQENSHIYWLIRFGTDDENIEKILRHPENGLLKYRTSDSVKKQISQIRKYVNHRLGRKTGLLPTGKSLTKIKEAENLLCHIDLEVHRPAPGTDIEIANVRNRTTQRDRSLSREAELFDKLDITQIPVDETAARQSAEMQRRTTTHAVDAGQAMAFEAKNIPSLESVAEAPKFIKPPKSSESVVKMISVMADLAKKKGIKSIIYSHGDLHLGLEF